MRDDNPGAPFTDVTEYGPMGWTPDFRTAALLGYGALLAHNTDGRFAEVLKAMDNVLNPPQLIAAGDA